jgi:beta-galactosidase
VAHVIIEVVDDEGRVVSLADNEVTVRINGEGRLLGLEGGDMSDTSNLRDNRQRVVRGRLLAYVESTESVGEIVVSATSPLLGQAQLEMKVE